MNKSEHRKAVETKFAGIDEGQAMAYARGFVAALNGIGMHPAQVFVVTNHACESNPMLDAGCAYTALNLSEAQEAAAH